MLKECLVRFLYLDRKASVHLRDKCQQPIRVRESGRHQTLTHTHTELVTAPKVTALVQHQANERYIKPISLIHLHFFRFLGAV